MPVCTSRNDQALGRVITSNWVQLIEDGMEKKARVSATSYIRSFLREEGIARKIISPIMLSDDQLDKALGTDKPRKIIELEPDSRATYVPFRGMGPIKYFTGQNYEVVFGKIMSQRFSKSILELKTYDNDIRKILSDNAAKDIHTEEDGSFFATCAAIVGNNPAQQDLTFVGGFTRNNLAESLKALPTARMPIGCLVMNDVTAKEILKWDDTHVGDAVVSDHYYNGVTSGKLLGIKTIFTIKNDIIPDNVVWQFTTEDFLGKFFILLEPTVYIKTEADMLTFWIYESIGIGIGNTRGVIRTTFLP